jgi:hypothetical protein
MSDWHVMVIEGGERDVRAFVVDFMGKRPVEPTPVVLADDLEVDTAALADRLRTLRAGGQAVLVPDELMVPLVEAIEGTGLRVTEWRTIAGASFGFEAEASSREAAKAIRVALRPLGDVRFAEHSEHEDEQVHEQDGKRTRRYVFRTRGRAEGSLPGVLAFRRRLADVDAIRTTRLRLV